MKLYKKCFREFDENNKREDSPARELGDIFITAIGDVDIKDICPECREELGILNLMGFRP
ncbi:MAG: hypothetical protein ABSF13_14050 [Smithella sp.]|jgi:hypothetical protein